VTPGQHSAASWAGTHGPEEAIASCRGLLSTAGAAIVVRRCGKRGPSIGQAQQQACPTSPTRARGIVAGFLKAWRDVGWSAGQPV